MDDSTSATTCKDAAMYHSAGYTIEQTDQQDGMASSGAKGILFRGRAASHFLELCKIQLVNIALIVDSCMCNLTEKGNTGIEECKNIFRFSAHNFHRARFCIKLGYSSLPVKCWKCKYIYLRTEGNYLWFYLWDFVYCKSLFNKKAMLNYLVMFLKSHF